MSFRYFAYGSNLWVPQMRSRCPSATPIETAVLPGWRAIFDKPSTDGSAKLNIRPDPQGQVQGVIYRIADEERAALDAAEPGYEPVSVEVGSEPTLTYTYARAPHGSPPYDWYLATVRMGAAQHGLPDEWLGMDATMDPVCGDVRPASRDDLTLIGSILADGMAAATSRYYLHPGDYSWWVFHDDPRLPDHFSTWMQGDTGFVTVDSRGGEINAFTRPDVDRMPLIRWAQRRLAEQGEVGWVDDDDEELVSSLRGDGYAPIATSRSYRWHLGNGVPDPSPPAGWELRHLRGEHEANPRRAAAHAAFESTMPEALHLQRYLEFMRSPVYVSERDLVAISPDGRVGAFMIWWADRSGVAQIEPFGTHPDFHRQGVGRALLYHGLWKMRRAGMHTCRVITDDWRGATDFYSSVGFEDVGRLRWWKKV